MLDCACGIGTQAIGLAQLGYRVVGSDISPGELARARREANRLGVGVTFVTADFRDLTPVDGEFDVVICCDNAIPHLLVESDVRRALVQMRARTRAGGLLVVTMRDFDAALVDRPAIAPPIAVPGSPRRVLVRLHDWDDGAPTLTVRYLVLTESGNGWAVTEHSMRYRAITRAELTAAAVAAGYRDVSWPTDRTIVGGQLVMTARVP